MLRIMLQPFEAWIGLACVITAVTFFLSPATLDTSTVGRATHPYAFSWTLAYGFAGIVLLCGIIRGRSNLTAMGLILLVGGALVNLYALVVIVGAEAVVSEITLGAVMFAAAAKVYALVWLSANGNSNPAYQYDPEVTTHPDRPTPDESP